MDNLQINKQKILELVKYGTYYNPAYKHYGEEGNVYCDKCKKQDLSVCIGYETMDLCLQCVEEVADCIKNPGLCKCPCANKQT